jgi:hypothetical protein
MLSVYQAEQLCKPNSVIGHSTWCELSSCGSFAGHVVTVLVLIGVHKGLCIKSSRPFSVTEAPGVTVTLDFGNTV